MKTKEFLVVLILALFVGTGAGVTYLLGTAQELETEDAQQLGNLTLTQLGPNSYSLTGDVGIGDCERIIPQLPTTQPFTLVLESPGGSLGDGMCLAANFKLRNVITVIRDTPVLNADGVEVYTPGVNTETGKTMTAIQGKPVTICASSCSLIFMSGVEGVLIGDVYLGIHEPRSSVAVGDTFTAEASADSTANQRLKLREFNMGIGS